MNSNSHSQPSLERRDSLLPSMASGPPPLLSSSSFADGGFSNSSQNMMGGTPVRPEDFIERGCFFFYDAHHEDETAEADDILLYFYPEEVPRDSKLFLQGACSAMIAFASKFTNKPVDVVTLKRTKIAFKSLPGKITLVLLFILLLLLHDGDAEADDGVSQVLTSSAMGEEDATLAYQLEALYRAFRFYNGSFADVFEVRTLPPHPSLRS